jgi:hypothetical protein
MAKSKPKERKVMITERALAQRINRALAKEDEGLKKAKAGSRMDIEYGRYYTLDYSRNQVIHSGVDIESLGRELGVLKPYEALAAD